MIARKQEQQDLENHKLVVHLRQDLERVRNLCYMVSRREKLSRSLFKLREQVFYKQISVLSDANLQTSEQNEKYDDQFKNAVIYANDGPTLYDRFYSSCDKNTPTQYQSLEYILEKLLGGAKNGPKSGNRMSKTSTSPNKRAIKAGVSTNAASSSSNITNITGKANSNKKVNNGAITTSKTSSLISTSNDVNDVKQLVKKCTNTNRRSTATTTVPAVTTPTSRHRSSALRTSLKSKTSKNATNSSDESSSSSGSTSSDDDDSSSNDSTSASASSSGSGSESTTSDSDSSSQTCSKENTPKAANKSIKKVVRTKRKTCQRTIEDVGKLRRKSITQSKVENVDVKITKASKDLNKSDITTVLSSSSEIETESKNKNKPKVSVPVKVSGISTSKAETSVSETTIQNASNLLLPQSDNIKPLRTDENGSSSDEAIEVTPKKCNKKPLVKSLEGNRNFSTRKKNADMSACRKAVEKIYTDTECSSDLDNKDKEEKATESNVSDSQNQQTIRTKAAMKEFTLQQQSCNKIQQDLSTSLKTSGKSEKPKDLNADTHEIVTETPQQQKANKLSSDLLVVPQRQAAKKASENMRSTNALAGMTSSSYSNASTTGQLQRDVEIKHRDTLTKPKDIVNIKSDDKVEKRINSNKINEQNIEKPIVNKRGRPPKNSKDTVDPSQSSHITSLDRSREPPASVEPETKKIYTLSTDEEKLEQNKSSISESAKPSTPNDVSKNNILVAYVVPQRQAAKKAAEQLKNSNKASQINPESALVQPNTTDEKDRANITERESKLKAIEDRTSKSTPSRRMSLRESSNSLNKNDGLASTTVSKKIPTSTRRRSKDDAIQSLNQKRSVQPIDKKRKLSATSSSDSDSSSSSSSSDGSEDSSSNSGSSCSSSSSDDEVTDIDEKEAAPLISPNKEKICLQKTIKDPIPISQQNTNTDEKGSEKQINQNAKNSTDITLIDNEEQSSNKSNVQTRRKSSVLEEHPLDRQVVYNSQAEDIKCNQLSSSSSPATSNKISSSEESEPKNLLNESVCKDLNSNTEKETSLPSELVVDKELENTPENKSATTPSNVKEADENVGKLIEKETLRKDVTTEKFNIKPMALVNTNSESELVEKNTSISRDECTEVPMDIDEDLTAVPNHSSLPSEDHSLLKTDELLINLDPPAAPMPASLTTSSCSSGEENEQSNESNEDQENVSSTRRRKVHGRRRNVIGSPPILAEEEHTHHTQHLLNEMELIRALEEEHKKELAASKNDEIKVAESKTSSVKITASEPLEIIDLDSNSNSEHAATSPKPSLENFSAIALKTNAPESSFDDPSPICSKEQSNIDTLRNESNFPTSNIPAIDRSLSKDSCQPLPINTSNSAMESGHHPIVDTILDLEDNAKKKQEENQQQMHNFPNVLLNSSPFGSHSVGHVLDQHSESLTTLLTNDNNTRKEISEEDSFQATRNLLEKLRKTKRNRTDDQKEPDLMLPPPTPAIPSVFPFHNAADPEDIIHAQKEGSLSSLEANSTGHYSIDSSQTSQAANITNNNNLLVDSSPTDGSLTKKDTGIDIYGNISHGTTNTARTPTNADNICSISNSMSLQTFIEENGQSVQPLQQQTQLSISPMPQQHSAQQTSTPHHSHSDATPNSNYNQQQSHTPTQQTPSVVGLTSLIQNELVSQNNSSLNKASTLDNFGQKQTNALSSNAPISGSAPDFVDLHAAAAASKDFTSAASIRSNKLVVDCDFDENTRMQSPYTMQANRIWNENDLIAARRSTSPSSVSESNDQTPSIDLQQQQTPVPHQIPIQGSHVQTQQHSLTPNVLNSSSSNSLNKNSFFNSINNFGLASSFQQHPLQTQNQLSQQPQQQPSISNGIDPMIYNQSYSSTPTTPTTQGTPQQQQSNVQQQRRSQQFNGSVNLFNDAATTLPNLNQISFVSNDTNSVPGGSVMYPAGPGIGTNVNAASNAGSQQSRPDLYTTNSSLGSTNSSSVQYSGVAFTSSTHNIALTAAIVGVSGGSSLIDHNSPRHHQMRSSHQYNLTSPSNTNTSASFNNMHLGSCAETLLPNQTQTSHHTTPTKDSPSKPNRSSSRFCQQTQQQTRNSHKSPQVTQHKSPGKSPRQMEQLSKQLQQQQQTHAALTEYPNLNSKQTKYDSLTHTLAGKPRQRAPRGTGSGSRGRGRGRGRSRGNNAPNTLISLPIPMSEYVSADNLVGTPFEFSYEEEMTTPGMENLQSLRDRRRSFDCRNSQNTEALKYRSPSYSANACKIRNNTGSTSASTASTGTGAESIVNCNNNMKGSTSTLHSIVQPMLPGPVDMRTYNLGFEPQHSSASQEAYNNNLLGAFDSGTADQTLSEFDEDDEREFQSTLRATGTSSSITTKQLQLSMVSTINTSSISINNTVDSVANGSNSIIQTYTESMTSNSVGNISTAPTPISNVDVKGIGTTSTGIVCQANSIMTAINSAELVTDLQTSMETTSEDVSIDSDTTLTTKASLSDARNQLKLKIKGPLAYPDSYNSSNANVHTSTAGQSNMGNVQSMVSTNATISASIGGSGTNSRRMRKKELLSLYVVQKDTHGDDSSCGLPPTDSSLLSNAIETTRKTESVCSEADEYGSDFIAGTSNNKRLKKNSSRELRSLDVGGDINETSTGLNLGVDGRRRSGCSSGSTDNSATKIGAACSAGRRRGRSKTLEGIEDEPTPKLKIKIRGLTEGNVSATASVGNCDRGFNNYDGTRRAVACPPKKRLTSNYTPTLEDLKRDSMNYRDQVMQEFGGDDEDRIKRTSGSCSNYSKTLTDMPPTKKMKSSKSKKEKKDKKRSRNKDLDDTETNIACTKDNNSMITTLIEQPTSASPGEPPKLILRINKRKTESTATDTSRSSPATGPTTVPATLSPEGPSAPIRLKLARVSEGGGYVIGDKKRKKGKKSNMTINSEDLINANLNTNCSIAVNAAVTINDMEKFAEDANAQLGMASPTTATFGNYTRGPNEPQSITESISDAAKDSSTPSPCLVIDSSKSNDIHDSSNTASSLNDMSVPCISESIHSLAATPTAVMASRNCNENSNSQSSLALSSHSHLSNSNSNSLMSAAHQSQNSTGNSSSITNQHNNININNSNSNNNSNSASASSSSGILALQKNCEVR